MVAVALEPSLATTTTRLRLFFVPPKRKLFCQRNSLDYGSSVARDGDGDGTRQTRNNKRQEQEQKKKGGKEPRPDHAQFNPIKGLNFHCHHCEEKNKIKEKPGGKQQNRKRNRSEKQEPAEIRNLNLNSALDFI